MDLKQLRALLAVGEHQSFSAAARALHTVQSNVSTHVSRLEREIGVTLIDRSTNTLTEEGLVVAERARRIEAEFNALESDVASLRDEVRGKVRLGVIGTTARWLVPLLLVGLAQRHPAIKVVILDATTSSLVPQLLAGQIDLAIMNLPVDDPDLSIETLFDEERVLVAPAGHALYDRTSVTLADLAEYELLL
jgi:DNA-binding transcriptional LysR family regulator